MLSRLRTTVYLVDCCIRLAVKLIGKNTAPKCSESTAVLEFHFESDDPGDSLDGRCPQNFVLVLQDPLLRSLKETKSVTLPWSIGRLFADDLHTTDMAVMA